MTQHLKNRPPPAFQPATPPEPDDQELRMSLLDHLNELRSRAVKTAIAVAIGFVFGMLIAPQVLDILRQPYGSENQFIALGPTDAVVSFFRVALMVGGILAVPVITYQLLMFILPGLTNKERRYLLTALPAIFLLFIIGVLFTWFVLIPPAIGFFDNFMPDLFNPQWTAERYLGFVTALLFWMGAAFETPLIFFVLSLLGLVQASVLLKNWRVAIVGAAVAAALITPTIDPVNMMLVMGPLLALYLLSILLVLGGRRLAKLTD
ncbi:MAG: twin-arginine translocase subunit TatC [Anaerolineae bacterium]|nr:twin-arginine translocase subunit TatC [Anaerolineae bacterium]